MINYKRLVFISEPTDVHKFIKVFCPNRELIVSFSIAGKLTLNKKGIDCKFIDEVIGLPDLNQIGIDNLERVKNICNFLDYKLRQKISVLEENNINFCSFAYFYIKIIFDVIYTSYFILEKLFKEINAKEIIIFKKDGRIENQITIDLLNSVFLKEHNNVKIIINNQLKLNDLDVKFKKIVKFIYRRIREISKENRCIRSGIILDKRYDITYLAEELLENINFYEINDFLLEFLFMNLNPLWIKKIKSKKKEYKTLIAEVFTEATCNKNYRDLFLKDNSLFIFTNKWLKDYFSKTIVSYLPYTSYLKERLLKLNPKILITSSCRFNFLQAFIFGLIKSLGIPVVTYQEGGGAGYIDWPLFNLDVELSDYFLVYGESVKESPFIEKGKAKIVSVGSIRFEKIKKTIKAKVTSKTTIVIVLDNFKEDFWQHYPYNGGFFSQAYRYQLKILDILKCFREVNFILKIVKGKEMFYENYRDFFQVETKPLIKILNNVSAFILEYPSTVLQECLLTNKPIALLCNKDTVKFEPSALALLKRRVRLCCKPENFYETIRFLIKDIEYGTEMVNEKEFQNNYCLSDNVSENLRFFLKDLKNNLLY